MWGQTTAALSVGPGLVVLNVLQGPSHFSCTKPGDPCTHPAPFRAIFAIYLRTCELQQHGGQCEPLLVLFSQFGNNSNLTNVFAPGQNVTDTPFFNISGETYPGINLVSLCYLSNNSACKIADVNLRGMGRCERVQTVAGR